MPSADHESKWLSGGIFFKTLAWITKEKYSERGHLGRKGYSFKRNALKECFK